MKRFFQSSYLVIILLLMYIPIFVMMMFSFNSSSNITNFTGWSFKWYGELLDNSPFLKSITTSLFVAITSTIISIIIGVMAVVGLSRLSAKRQSRWISIANIPLINADIITAVSLMVVFLILGLNFGIFTLIAAHVSFNVPYVIITVMPFLKRVDKNIVSASEDLGSSPFQTFFKVVLPILIPSIITAAAICFSMSFDDFIISYFTGGDQTNVSTFIYTAKKIQPYINAFGTLLVITIFLAILGYNIIKGIAYNNEKRRSAVRKGEYKSKAILNYKSQIEINKQIIESGTRPIKTKNLWLLIKYRFLILSIKMVKNKNYYSKISKLEWKVEVINKKITKEANAQISHDALVYKQKALEVKLKAEKNKAKAEKLEAQIYKLQKRIDKALNLIERVQHQKAVNEEKAREIQEWIEELKTELANKEHNDLYVKKSNQKIVNLTIRRQEILDGKSKRKLKTNLIKLNQLKNSQDEKIAILYINLEDLKKHVFKQVSLAYEFDLRHNWNILSHADLTQKRNEYIMLAKQNVESENEDLSQKIKEIKTEEEILRNKYFPTGNDGYSKGKSYIQRTWKTFATIFILVTSFGLITTSYVMNNIYDIVIGNWGSYIDPIVIKKFEEKYGVKVNYQQYDSNEIMYNKNITFRYDVMVPSDYMAVKLAQDNYLMPIDWKLVNEYNPELGMDIDEETGVIENPGALDPNWFKQVDQSKIIIEHEDVEDTEAKLSEYAAPFFWGDVRIAFNTQKESVINFLNSQKISIPDNGEINPSQLSWNILWDAAEAGLDVALNEDPKNFLMYSLGKEGRVSPRNQNDIDIAKADLTKLVKYKTVGLYTDQLIEKVQTGNFDVAVIYNGDLVSSTSTWMDDRDYDSSIAPFAQGYVAKDGEVTNTWSDSMVVSNTARNADLAHKWIAFILEEQIQKLQFDYTGYLGALSSINDKPGFDSFLDEWFEIGEGQAFQLNEKLDQKVVEAFNEIRASK